MLDDSASYLFPAYSFLNTGHFLEASNTYMIFRTPGYPAFLAAIFYLFGNHLTVIIYTQIILSIIPIVCAYLIGKRLFSENIGLCAAILVAFDYLIWGHSYFILSDTLFAVMLSLVYVIGVYIFSESSPRFFNIFCLGFFLALATLVRPASYLLLFPILFGMIVFAIARQISWKKTLVMLLIFLLPNMFLVGGWQLRNHLTLGTYQYSKITGKLGMQVFFPENYQLFIEEQRKSNKNYQVNKISMNDDIKMLVQYPGQTAKQVLFGVAKTLFMPDRAWMQLIGNQQDMSLLDNVKQEFYQLHLRDAWSEFKQIPFHGFTVLYIVGAICISLILYFLILVTIVKVKLSRNLKFAHLFLLGCAFYFLLICSNNESSVRYRLPFEIIINIYAAVGLMSGRRFLFIDCKMPHKLCEEQPVRHK